MGGGGSAEDLPARGAARYSGECAGAASGGGGATSGGGGAMSGGGGATGGRVMELCSRVMILYKGGMTPGHARGETLDIQAGEVIGGRYRADRVIGRGETGLVIGATDLLRGGGVAIKMLEPLADEVEMLTERLRREAHVLAQLTSPHVVRVFDVEKHGRAVCLVMELLRGGTLAEVLRRRGPLPIDEAVGHLLQACDGVAEAHAIGIVHRDLKPQNLYLAERDDGSSVVKVLDFGVSKQSGGAMGLTATGAALGSPLYTAIEQLKDASRVDARADIWSLGLVLYFLLCRRNAFDADNPIALILRIGTAPPHPLRERRPEVPPELEAAIFRCVEKDANKRFQTVAELARALVPFAPPWGSGYLASIEARTARRSLQSMPPVAAAPGAPSPSVPPAPKVPVIDPAPRSAPAAQGPLGAVAVRAPVSEPAPRSAPAAQGPAGAVAPGVPAAPRAPVIAPVRASGDVTEDEIRALRGGGWAVPGGAAGQVALLVVVALVVGGVFFVAVRWLIAGG